jgi:hypothetical protein
MSERWHSHRVYTWGSDCMVKLRDVRDQVESLRAMFPAADIRLRIVEGEGHAFDYDKDYDEFVNFFAS